ncbi:hypothetical protein Ocin01_17227 [Orchesella cincta]|uniref:Uncharacterized protein n=1 Tax=Orchesella cincta TaxID=48709 RepID=A0A1D2M900_ORCCI|nr:hypothetical protein Ocin01_17227 [Orchesella cincta]
MADLKQRVISWSLVLLVCVNLLAVDGVLLNRGVQKAADPVYRRVNRYHRPHFRKTHARVSMHKASTVPEARPPPSERTFNSSTVEDVIEAVGALISDDTLRQIFANCLPSTLDTTIGYHVNATQSSNGLPYTYIITGDIPAMWIRDSTYQINPYVPLAKNDPALRQLVLGVINTQAEYLNLHAYANAFLPLKHWNSGIIVDPPESTDEVVPPYDRSEVWEAKYELDSIASFLYLSQYYYKSTQDLTFVNNTRWVQGVRKVVETMRKMQGGTLEVLGKEPYKFTRMTRTQSETQNLYGLGNPVKRCGLVRSFFRPSDDASIFHYLIPANALAVVGLEGVANILLTARVDPALLDEVILLAAEIREGIQRYGVVRHPQFGDVFAYEVDCYGSQVFMDDANFPSILSMAKFGFVTKDDPTYLRSRQYILSPDWNPYFAAGKYPGIGSPHTGLQKPWHMAVAMQAMTSDNDQEILTMLRNLNATTAEQALVCLGKYGVWGFDPSFGRRATTSPSRNSGFSSTWTPNSFK